MGNNNFFVDDDGRLYALIESKTGACDGCSFLGEHHCHKPHEAPPCQSQWREDERDILFVAHEKAQRHDIFIAVAIVCAIAIFSLMQIWS